MLVPVHNGALIGAYPEHVYSSSTQTAHDVIVCSPSPGWESYASDAVNYWTAFNAEWLQFTGPLHIVRFEDFQLNLNATLSSLLRFLNASVSLQDIECALKHSRGRFKRREKWAREGVAEDDIITPEMTKRFVESEEKFGMALKNYTIRRRAAKTVL